MNFLISSPSTKVLPRFLPTDVLGTTFWHFLKKCDRKSNLGYITTEFWGDISNFWKTCSIFLSIQMNFHTHRRFVWLFILNVNIFNCHAWQCLKVSANLVDYNIFTFRATPSLKFSDDLVYFLSFFHLPTFFLNFYPPTTFWKLQQVIS